MQKVLLPFFVCLIALNVSSQQITISGKVTDNKNRPLSGATIPEKGINKAIITKDDGSLCVCN